MPRDDDAWTFGRTESPRARSTDAWSIVALLVFVVIGIGSAVLFVLGV